MNTNYIKDLVERIISLENKYFLFEIKFKDKYPIWPYYRMYFYYGLLKSNNIFSERGVSQKKISLTTIRKFIKLVFYSKLHIGLLPQDKKYILISSQRYKDDVEIYTQDLKDVLKNDYVEFSLSNKFNFHHGPVYLDLFKVLFKIIAQLLYRLNSTPNSIKNFFIEVGATDKFINEFKKYKIEYILWFWFYHLIFSIQKPIKVFVVGGVYYTPMIAAAQSLNIKVYEIQHGVINNFHLAYHFPKINRDGFFSEGILLLSNFWKSKAEYPIGTELITIGNNFYAAGESSRKKQKMIVILGDGTLARAIISFVSLNINYFIVNGYEVNYKLHPDEIYNWEKRYEDLGLMRENGLLKVITNTPSLADLLSDCSIIFGVNSTAIYEGLDRDCKAFILDMQSSEYFDDLQLKGVVKKIDPHKLLTDEDLQFNPNKTEKFFAPTDFESIKNLIMNK